MLAGLAKFAENFNQEQFHVRAESTGEIGDTFSDGSFNTLVYTWDVADEESAAQLAQQSGLTGFSISNGQLTTYYAGEPNNTEATNRFRESVKRFSNSNPAQKGNERAGENGNGAKERIERLWIYGDGRGAIGYEKIRGELRTARRDRPEQPNE